MSDDALRERIGHMLAAGLATEWARRADMSAEVIAACRRLQELESDDVKGRLVIAGFSAQPFVAPDDEDGIEQCCATCMYFERHREFCGLPELMLPVDPRWSCVLWRI